MGKTRLWALKIVLRDGRTVTAGATMRMRISEGDDPLREVLTTIGQVAARYQIPAQLTGKVSRIRRADTRGQKTRARGSLPGLDAMPLSLS